MKQLAWDWYPGAIPANAEIDETAYVETTYSFHLYRSRVERGLRMGRGASTYLGTMFDVGPEGRVQMGDYALVHGAWIISDASVEIGAYSMISWNVVILDTYRVPFDPVARRAVLKRVPLDPDRRPRYGACSPVRIGANVWIGFGVCVLPGVTIGDGSIVGAGSVVTTDVPPYTAVAGNPAAPIRRLEEN